MESFGLLDIADLAVESKDKPPHATPTGEVPDGLRKQFHINPSFPAHTNLKEECVAQAIPAVVSHSPIGIAIGKMVCGPPGRPDIEPQLVPQAPETMRRPSAGGHLFQRDVRRPLALHSAEEFVPLPASLTTSHELRRDPRKHFPKSMRPPHTKHQYWKEGQPHGKSSPKHS